MFQEQPGVLSQMVPWEHWACEMFIHMLIKPGKPASSWRPQRLHPWDAPSSFGPVSNTWKPVHESQPMKFIFSAGQTERKHGGTTSPHEPPKEASRRSQSHPGYVPRASAGLRKPGPPDLEPDWVTVCLPCLEWRSVWETISYVWQKVYLFDAMSSFHKPRPKDLLNVSDVTGAGQGMKVEAGGGAWGWGWGWGKPRLGREEERGRNPDQERDHQPWWQGGSLCWGITGHDLSSLSCKSIVFFNSACQQT
jgi:hypothetical protein